MILPSGRIFFGYSLQRQSKFYDIIFATGIDCQYSSYKYYRKYGKSYEKVLEKLASKKTAYYVWGRIERILRKQRNPTMKQTPSKAGYYFPVCFSNHKPVFIASRDSFGK